MDAIEIEDWERESGHFLNVGRKVTSVSKQAKYEISGVSVEGITLKEIPYFKNQKAEPLEISYEEFLNAYKEDIFLIEGFEAGQERELKIAIASLIKKLRIRDKDQRNEVLEMQYQQKNAELEQLRSEAEARKKHEEEELSRKQEEARLQAEQHEQERIRKEEAEKKAKEEALRKRKADAAAMETKLIEIDLSL
jgi:hypothetical protein